MLDIHLASLSPFSLLENGAVVFVKQDTIWRDVNSSVSEHKCGERLAGFPVSASQKFQFVEVGLVKASLLPNLNQEAHITPAKQSSPSTDVEFTHHPFFFPPPKTESHSIALGGLQLSRSGYSQIHRHLPASPTSTRLEAAPRGLPSLILSAPPTLIYSSYCPTAPPPVHPSSPPLAFLFHPSSPLTLICLSTPIFLSISSYVFSALSQLLGRS